jgi:hypothetical protein
VGNLSKSGFFVFPNPASGNITISSESDFHALEIVDLMGRVVHSQTNNENNTTLNIANFSDGLYFVRIITETGAEVQKFVKR